MRVLVTGATGLLGQQLVGMLSQQGHEVTGLYHTGHNLVGDSCNASFRQCDIRRENELLDLLRRDHYCLDAIVHCAAITDVDRCEKDRDVAYRTNVLGTRHVLRCAEAFGARLIYVSTNTVFSGQHGNHAEDDIPNPSNFYSLTKLLAEEIVLTRRDSLIVRADILGIHPLRKQAINLVEWLVARINQNEDLSLFKDVMVNPISNITLAEILGILLTYTGDEQTFHVGSSDVASKAKIGRLIIDQFPKYTGKVQEISVDALGLAAKRPKETWLDTKKVVQKLQLNLPLIEKEIFRILQQTGVC